MVELAFSYLQMLRDGGVPRHFFEEVVAASELGFAFAEPAEPLPVVV